MVRLVVLNNTQEILSKIETIIFFITRGREESKNENK